MNKATTAFATIVSILAASLSLAGPMVPPVGELLVNGDFEMPGLANPSDAIFLPDGSTLVTGWVSVDNIPSGSLFVDNLLVNAPYYGFPASSGSHFIYIDNNNGPTPSLNGIYQDFSSITGQQYRVTFDATTELAYGTSGLLGVSAGDTYVNYTLPNVPGYPTQPYIFTGWSTYTFTFTATSNTTRLQFFDRGFQVGGNPTIGNASPLIDNVSVRAVPEPSTATQFICGICILTSLRLRRY